MEIKQHFTICPIGDTAIQVSFGNMIDRKINGQVSALSQYFKQHPFTGLVDIIPAYSNISFSFDVFAIRRSVKINTTVHDWVKDKIEAGLMAINIKALGNAEMTKPIKVPVCYDDSLGNDLAVISKKLKVPIEELINLHTSQSYFVYMLGFLPGFAYMGELDKALAYPRRATPQKVKAGSIGIAGRQTGIYPLNSFGGWHILGHTSLKPFDIQREEPCYFKTGQEVVFFSIGKEEYQEQVRVNR